MCGYDEVWWKRECEVNKCISRDDASRCRSGPMQHLVGGDPWVPSLSGMVLRPSYTGTPVNASLVLLFGVASFATSLPTPGFSLLGNQSTPVVRPAGGESARDRPWWGKRRAT